ncbi:MAG: phage tail protein [Rhodocyclaceae bacterium]|jgi:phage tail-like protein|nr:phage tail protein [Rhodocyclaceae bacterium]
MTLPLSSRFAVVIFALGIVPNPIDLRFQRVSGLSASISTVSVREGGQQLYTHRLPDMVSYENLVLERGFMVGSPLNIEFNMAFSQMKFAPSNVMVTLLNDDALPIAGWMFVQAFPVRWSTADLDASRDEVLIDTLELAYTRMQAIRI